MAHPAAPPNTATAVGTAGDTPASRARRIVALLRDGDVDLAIDAGLMDLDAPSAGLPADDALFLHAARERLRTAWAARERHRRRAARLARDAAATIASAPPPPGAAAAPAPALPAAAAAALARARARAAGRP